jgi:hypothetical protein
MTLHIFGHQKCISESNLPNIYRKWQFEGTCLGLCSVAALVLEVLAAKESAIIELVNY